MRGSRRTVVIAIVGLANDDVSILSLFFRCGEDGVLVFLWFS